jgi:hypothetical protein
MEEVKQDRQGNLVQGLHRRLIASAETRQAPAVKDSIDQMDCYGFVGGNHLVADLTFKGLDPNICYFCNHSIKPFARYTARRKELRSSITPAHVPLT